MNFIEISIYCSAGVSSVYKALYQSEFCKLLQLKVCGDIFYDDLLTCKVVDCIYFVYA